MSGPAFLPFGSKLLLGSKDAPDPDSGDDIASNDLALSYATIELTVSWFLLIVCVLSTLLVHRAHARGFCTWLPPSIVVILLGVITGLLSVPFLRATKHDGLRFDPLTFWFGILPPIIFAAGWNLKRKDFFRNILPCTLYAVVGTALTAIVFGLCTYLLMRLGLIHRHSIGHNALIECLMFGSLIAATDPVATLSVLSNVRVPRLLYNLIFGESVLNDPISLQLFATFKKFASSPDQIDPLAIVSDFTFVAISSIFIGCVIAAIGAAILFRTRLGEQDMGHHDGSIFEIFVVLATSYLAYLVSDVLELSGIFSIFFAGVVHAHYSFHNITDTSRITLRRIIDLAATIAETLMFSYLGMQVFTMQHTVDWGLILSGLPLCLISRAANIFPLSAIVNMFRDRPIPGRVQLFQFFCGLRGAVAYALVLNMPMFDRNESGRRKVLHRTNPAVETATLFTVITTTVLFGIASAPLLKLLGLEGKTDYDIGVSDARDVPSSPSRRFAVGSRAGSMFCLAPGDSDEDEADEEEEGAAALATRNANVNASAARRPADLESLRVDAPPGSLSPQRRGAHALWRQIDNEWIKPILGGRMARGARTGNLSPSQLNSPLFGSGDSARASPDPVGGPSSGSVGPARGNSPKRNGGVGPKKNALDGKRRVGPD